MITIKASGEIAKMKQAGVVAVAAMKRVAELIRPGITTKELDAAAYDVITSMGAKPNFKGYGGFPGTMCASLNDVVVHGFPSDDPLKEGDILSVDMGAVLHGYHSDMARTFAVGEIADKHRRLIKVTRECFYLGMAQAKAGNRICDISKAVEDHAVAHGYGVVRELVGHGIGQALHEAPDVPNFVYKHKGPVLRAGMTLAIEPMINLGTAKVDMNAPDGWTVRTADGEYSAHYENTVLVGENGPELLTVYEEI